MERGCCLAHRGGVKTPPQRSGWLIVEMCFYHETHGNHARICCTIVAFGRGGSGIEWRVCEARFREGCGAPGLADPMTDASVQIFAVALAATWCGFGLYGLARFVMACANSGSSKSPDQRRSTKSRQGRISMLSTMRGRGSRLATTNRLNAPSFRSSRSPRRSSLLTAHRAFSSMEILSPMRKSTSRMTILSSASQGKSPTLSAIF